MEAVVFIAKNNNIAIEYVREEKNDEQIAEARRKEALLATLDHIQRFFSENLRNTNNVECRQAREYAYGRWAEEFCSTSGIGDRKSVV